MKYESIKPYDIRVRVYNDTAIVAGRASIKIKAHGEEGELRDLLPRCLREARGPLADDRLAILTAPDLSLPRWSVTQPKLTEDALPAKLGEV